MDIYTFIRSPDVAEYCRRVGKIWNTYEMAVIIGRSYRAIYEKRVAWRELMEKYPDAPTHQQRYRCKFKSIHQELAEILLYDDDSIVSYFDDFSHALYVDIPTPFKRGEILVREESEAPDIFVLYSLDSDNPEQLERSLKSSGYDNYITEGWGFFVKPEGIVYGDHIHNNDGLEYYNGKLVGVNRLLHYISLFYQDKIGLPALLTMQCRILLEQMLEHNLQIDVHGCYIPKMPAG